MSWKKAGIIFLGVVALCAGGLWLRHRDMKEEDTGKVKVGVTIYRDDDTHINSIITEMEKIFRKEFFQEISLNVVSARNSQTVQNDQVERFISLGYDVICVNAVDRTDVGRMVDLAMEADVPLVFFNREPVDDDLYRWENIYYVGSDAQESARLQGQIIAQVWEKDRDKLDLNGDGMLSFAMLEGERGHQDAVIRTEWSVRSLEEAGVPCSQVTGGVADWERDQAAALTEQWLKEYPDQIELFICNNDDMALGALDTLKKLGYSQINVVGIDGVQEGLEKVKSGEMLGTVSADRQLYGRSLLEISLALSRGENLPENLTLEGKDIWIPWEICSGYEVMSSSDTTEFG